MLINSYRFSIPWTPAQITTALWLDASDSSTITASAGKVSQWNDKSGNARNATQATSGLQPSFGSGSIAFNSNRLDIPAAAWPTDNYSIALVAQGAGTGSGAGSSGTGLVNINTSPADNPELRLITPFYNNYVYFNGGYAIANGLTSQISSKGILCFALSSGATAEIFCNGTSIASGTRAGALSATSSFTLGYYALTSSYASGTIWRLLVYPTSTTNRQKIEGWMCHQESLTSLLPADHPYKSVPPYV
jgi:hypothetical protein